MRAPALGVITAFVLWSALTWCAVSTNATEGSSALLAVTIDGSAALTFFGLVAIAVGVWVASRSPDDQEVDLHDHDLSGHRAGPDRVINKTHLSGIPRLLALDWRPVVRFPGDTSRDLT